MVLQISGGQRVCASGVEIISEPTRAHYIQRSNEWLCATQIEAKKKHQPECYCSFWENKNHQYGWCNPCQLVCGGVGGYVTTVIQFVCVRVNTEMRRQDKKEV